MNAHITRRFFVKGMGLLSASAALAACANNQGEESQSSAGTESAAMTNADGTTPLLAIVHTNDTHGHVVETHKDNGSGNFSMATVPALVKEFQDKGYDVLLLDAGDATQGAPLVDVSNGEAGITFMNACGYDLMCLGNHEFDRGDDQIKKYEELADFPLTSANVLSKETGECRFVPNTLFELTDGTKVGVFGLTTPATQTTAKPEYMAAFTILTGSELYACAQEQIDDLRAQGADLVVCLGHLGNQDACKPSTSKEVLENTTGIDLFIDGHDHVLVEEEVEGVLLVEANCYMTNIGLVVIDAGIPVNEGIAYGEFDGIDTAAQAVIDDINTKVEEELSVVLAATPFLLEGTPDIIRSQETNLGDLLTDAMLHDAREATGTDVDAAIINAGSVRAPIEPGDISLGDIKATLPYSCQYCTIRVTGAELLEAIEAGCQRIGSEGTIGGFPQVAGIEYTVDASVPYERGDLYPNSTFSAPAAPGARVTIHTVGGADFDEEATYTLVTGDFLAQGGDTYHAFKLATDREDPVICDFDYEALAGYLIGPLDHEVSDTYAEPQGRITIVNG